MSGVRGRLLSGAAFGAGALVLGTLVNLAATPYFYRHLGVAGYAAFLLLSSAIAFSHLLALGSHEAVSFFLAKPRSDTWKRQAEALAALFVIGGVLGVIFWSLAWFGFPAWMSFGSALEPEVGFALSQAIGAAGLLWLAQHFTQACWAFYRARLRLVEVGWMQLGTAFLPLLAAVLALASGASLPGFFLAQALTWIGVGCIALYGAFRGPEPLPLIPHWHTIELAQCIGYARWAFLMQVGFTLDSYGDRFLSAPLGSTAVSVFGTTTSLTLRIVSALGIVATLITPAISKIHSEHGLERAARAHGLALRATFWVGAALFLPLAVGGPTFLGHWMDPAWAEASQGWFVWVCIGAFWDSLAASMHGTLLGLGRPRVVALTSMLGLAAGFSAFMLLRDKGLWAVASFGVVAAAVNLLVKASWLHGRVLQRMLYGETLAVSALLAGLGWSLRRSGALGHPGMGIVSCVAAMGVAALGILALGTAWDYYFSRGRDRDSLLSIVVHRWGRRP